MDSAPPLSLTLLALPETTPATLYSLYEVFSSVGVAWSEITGEAPSSRLIKTRIASRDGTSFPSLFGVPIAPQTSLDEMPHSDIVVVTDLQIPLNEDPRGQWPAEVEWVRARYAAGAFLASVCTGSVFLADTGLLDGQEATSHWCATSLFATYYPEVKLRPERILSPSGPEHRIVTSGGASSWEDLALYLIARFCGPIEAVRIAKLFLLGDHSDGQLPYAAMGKPRRHEDATIARCQAWIADHYTEPNPVARLIAFSGLNPRTFKRRFKLATGYTPMDYVQALRIEEAKQVLETTREPTDSVAHLVGYEDPTFFRRLFKRRTGLTPARYRQRFQQLAGGRAAE